MNKKKMISSPMTTTTTTTSLASSRDDGGGGGGSQQNNDSAAAEVANERQWEAILSALTLYKTAFGDVNRIPGKFIVPNIQPWPKIAYGMRLGRVVMQMKQSGMFINNNLHRQQQVIKLGLDLSRINQNQQKQQDRRIQQQTQPPPPRRGQELQRRRQQQQQVTTTPASDQQSSNINNDTNNRRNAIRWERVLTAYKIYRKIQQLITKSSSSKITKTQQQQELPDIPPTSFIVPDMDPWPIPIRNLPLGQQLDFVIDVICTQNPDIMEQFISAGYPPPPVQQHAFNKEKRTNDNESVTTTTTTTSTTQSMPKDGSATTTTTETGAGGAGSASGVEGPPPPSPPPSPGGGGVNTRRSIMNERFERVCLALQTYKDIYGNLLVPQPFVVPSNTQQWPADTWGLRLGARVNAIRSQGTFISNHPERRKILDDIGFVWGPTKDSSSNSKAILRRRSQLQEEYNIKESIMEIINEVTTPNDNKNNIIPQASASDLESMFGDPTDIEKDYEMAEGEEQLLLANEQQQQDEETETEEKDDDDDVGDDDAAVRRRQRQQLQQQQQESMLISQSWNLDDAIIPDDVAARIEAEAAAAAKVGVGVGTTADTGLQQELEQVEQQEQDNVYIPKRTLHESLEEAKEIAIETGVIYGVDERGRVIKGKQDKQIPWFNDDFGDEFVFDDVVDALTIYKSMYGNFDNLTSHNSDFIIPAPLDDDDDDYDFLDDGGLGGGYNNDSNMNPSSRAAAAIARYDEEQQRGGRDDDFMDYGGQQDDDENGGGGGTATSIATETVVRRTRTSSYNEWPEHLSGMTLGHIVSRIRDGSLEVKHIPERKARLDAIDFDWGDPKYFIDIPFEKAMCGMYAYYMIRGDLFVDEEFIMPNDDPWPQVMAGYELGYAVKRLRQLQFFLESYHPEKVSLLRMLDFVFFSETMALPLDPSEPEMTSETLLLTALGHPDYSKLIDIPFGLPDKIIAEGPVVETNDDPKLWWRKWHNWDYVKDSWYQIGRRDNAYVLRGMGYIQMAKEHEEKYGPGLFTRINSTMTDINENNTTQRTIEEKKELLETLNFYRNELDGCTDKHPHEIRRIISDIDTKILIIMKETELDMAARDEIESSMYDEEEVVDDDDDDDDNESSETGDNEEGIEEEEDEEEEDFDDEVIVEGDDDDDDFNVEEELGLDM